MMATATNVSAFPNWYVPANPIQQLSASPSVWHQTGFLSAEYCEHLIRLAQSKLMPSLTVDPKTGANIQIQDRSSWLTYLTLGQDAIVQDIEARIAQLVQLPADHGEGLQILRYQPGQEYKPHFDYFDPTLAGSHKALAKGGQRVATALLYLSDVEAGGETYFPEINLKVTPGQGDLLLFYNLFANGQPDPKTLHASLPVITGEKWVSTKWIRQQPYR